MSSPRYDWWPYVKGMIRRFPELCMKYAELHTVSATANYSGMPGSHSGSRATELIAVRELPSTQQREYEAVRRAIETTRKYKNGDARMRMVQLAFWHSQEKLRLDAVARRLHYSTDSVQDWHCEFIRLVASNYGLLDSDGE
ncbi:hypothetical protein [Oscillibacter ruminantium]|uniref:hypothetical protein n=1 Tax=Oscillibacter ruminantium TaxID=1263547 RepID=UPI00058ACE3E|nr:hypothetical protein [Oscillibacter ruminantium]